MADVQIVVRVNPSMAVEIDEVVKKGRYMNQSEFVREAIREKLERTRNQ